jgi:hypothetical protein
MVVSVTTTSGEAKGIPIFYGGYMTKDEALKMAIEAFVRWEDTYKADCTEVINACKEALEQPLTRDWKHTIDERIARDIEFKDALEQPRWQGLTDDEDNAIIKKIWIWGNDFPYEKYRIAIEQALKDKNT